MAVPTRSTAVRAVRRPAAQPLAGSSETGQPQTPLPQPQRPVEAIEVSTVAVNAIPMSVIPVTDIRISSIPVVDREWRHFASQLMQRIRRSNPLPLAERFLNRSVCNKLLAMPQRLARIGLPRPREDKKCWLMLDSLFPQPKGPWLDEL